MKRFLTVLKVSLGAFALLGTSCATTNPMSSFVPAEAIGVVKVDSLKTLTANLNQFIKATDLGPLMTQGQTAEEYINPTLSQLGIKPQWIDWEKPVFSVVLPAQGTQKVDLWVCVPLTEGDKNVKAIQEALGAQSPAPKTVFSEGYLVILPQGDTLPKLPVAKSMDLTGLETLEKGGISFTFNWPNFTKALGPGWDSSLSQVRQELMKIFQNPSTQNALAKGQGDALGKLLLSLVDGLLQTNQISGSFKADQQGAWGRLALDFVRDSGVDKVLRGIPASTGAYDFNKYLYQGGFINGVASLDGSTLAAATEDLENQYLGAMGLSTEIQTKLKNTNQKLRGTLGSKASFSLDLEPNMMKLMALMSQGPTPQKAPEILQALGLRLVMVLETKDGSAYKAAMKDLYQGNILNEMLAGMFRSSVMPMDIRYSLITDQTEGDFTYDTLGTQMEFLGGIAGAPNTPEVQGALKSTFDIMNRLFKLNQKIQGNRVYMVLANQGVGELKTLSAQDGLPNPHSYKSAGFFVPENPTVVFNINPWKALQAVSTGMPMVPVLGSLKVPQGPDNLGWVVYGKVSGGRVEMGSGMRAEEIKALIHGLREAFGLSTASALY